MNTYFSPGSFSSSGITSARRACALIGTLFFLLFASRVCAADWALSGDLTTHDPSIIKDGSTWYVFSTGVGLSIKSSPDGLVWKQQPQLFTQELSWWRTYAPQMGNLDVWAPDLQAFNGRIWCYYCVSEFGTNNSAIGLKSCTRIAAGDWRDDGVIITSKAGVDAFNAIDPNLTIDASGTPWLAFGSWFDGIHVVQLDPSTMKPTGTYYSLANRSDGIEATNIVYNNGYYYLFVSIDKCCLGVNSTYKIAYGRSKNITGPYVDQSGVAMANGGGTVLDAGDTRWKGPGGQDVYQNGTSWIIARHAYDANNAGTPTLLISDLYWDANGWPTYTAPAASAAPSIVTAPLSATQQPGTALDLSVTATGSNLTYQWYKDGIAISGATDSTLSIGSLAANDAGKYTVAVSSGGQAVTSYPATVVVGTPVSGRLINLSVRTSAGTGQQTLIAGFIISGGGSKSVLVRGSGPTLANFGVTAFLPDPQLKLFSGQTNIGSNDDWANAPDQSAITTFGADKMGTFALNAKEAIISTSLAAGGYTAQVSDQAGGAGVALLEVFDSDPTQPGDADFDTEPRLTNLSARAQVGTGQSILIAGFIINGNVPQRVMIRGLGPTLTNFGVKSTLADPQLSVFDGSQIKVSTNDNWGSFPDQDSIKAAGGDVSGSYPLDSHDSVLILTLAPGGYTAQLSGVGGSTGVGLLEIYAL
jgi:arabinan endo-1,5-alpha-L-arabinosidase